MKLWNYYLKRNIRWIIILFLNVFVMSVIMDLKGIAFSEWIYGTMLGLFFILVIGGIDFSIYYRRHRHLIEAEKVIKISVDALEMPNDQLEEDYQRLLQVVHEDKVRAVNDLESRKKDIV